MFCLLDHWMSLVPVRIPVEVMGRQVVLETWSFWWLFAGTWFRGRRMNFADQHRDGAPAWGIVAGLPSARWWLTQGHLNTVVTRMQRQQGDSPDSVHSENIWEIQNSFSGFKRSLVLQEFSTFTCMKCWATVHYAESMRLTLFLIISN